jgi:hypothetical protein
MIDSPLITLYIKGKDLSPFKKLVTISPEMMTLDLNAIHPVPNESELRELEFSGRSGKEQDCVDISELVSLWKKDNWGIDDPNIQVVDYIVRDSFMLLNFRVKQFAPVEFISHLTERHPEVFIFLGYNHASNPVKYSFVCRNGNVWPLKAEGMLTDFSGSAIFLDKTGNYRYAKDNELIEYENIDFYSAQNHMNYFLQQILQLT